MEVRLAGQGRALLLALAMGVGMGLLYDLLRPLRYRLGRVAGALLDLLYGLLCGAGAFVFAMAADQGRLGIWELSAALLGFLLYLYLPSRFVLPLLQRIADSGFHLMALCKKILDKTVFSLKRFFQNVRK